MSKVEELEYNPDYWHLQIGFLVEDLEYIPAGPQPRVPAQVPNPIALIPNLVQPDPNPVPVQNIIVFTGLPAFDPLWDSDPYPKHISSIGSSTTTSIDTRNLHHRLLEEASVGSHQSRDQAQLERIQELILPEPIPSGDLSVDSSHPS